MAKIVMQKEDSYPLQEEASLVNLRSYSLKIKQKGGDVIFYVLGLNSSIANNK